MPFLIWPALAATIGVITGIVYEKESDQPVVTVKTEPSFSWWDKLLFAGCGIAAYYIYKKAK